MNPIGKMILGAAGMAAGCLLAARQRSVRNQITALSRRVEELADRAEAPALSVVLDSQAQRLSSLEEETRRHGQAIQEVQTAVDRMERGFTLLGERLATQTEILETLQVSYAEKERRLQTALRAVIDAVNDIRRTRAEVR